MDAGHKKTARKNSDLRSRKAEIGLLTPKEIITTREVATQTENDAEVEAKIYLCIACITREIQIIDKRLSHLPGVQEEKTQKQNQS
jgi:hypothetical protein